MNCHSIVSPIQFDTTPRPLLVRKTTYVEREEYDIHYDHNSDFLTVIKTEVLVRHQSSSSDYEPSQVSALPHWNTIKEVYFKEEEDPDIIQESTDEGVYEEVTQNSTYLNEDKEEEDENKNSFRSLRSIPSMDVSSVVSMISLTVFDYLSWTNFFKILVVLFCINGLLLQIILLTVKYFSYETAVDIQLHSEEDSDQNSVTLCLPFTYEEVIKTSGDENNTFVTRIQRRSHLSDVFRISSKIQCSSSVCQNPVQSIDNSFKCFTYVFGSEIELSVNSSLQSSDPLSSYRVSVHSSKSLSNSFEDDFKALDFYKSYELRFWSIRMKRLSQPYTRCQTYHKSWTRSQCLHKCVIDLIKNFCPNCVPKEVFILESDFNQSMKFCPKYGCGHRFQHFLSDCQPHCPQDCSQEIYFSSVFSSEESDSKVSLIIRKTNTFARNGDFEFQQKPVLTLELYFASLGGLSVAWLMAFLVMFTIIYLIRKLTEIFSIE